jgi:hypothetical protein
MFIDGLEKTAGVGAVGEAVGKAIGKATKFVKEDVTQTARRFKQRGQAFQRGLRAGSSPRVNPVTGRAKPEIGENLAKKQTAHALPDPKFSSKEQQEFAKSKIKDEAGEAVKARASKSNEAKKGPGFAMRHPFLTAGAGLMTAKYVMNGSKKQDGQYGDSPNNPVSPY